MVWTRYGSSVIDQQVFRSGLDTLGGRLCEPLGLLGQAFFLGRGRRPRVGPSRGRPPGTRQRRSGNRAVGRPNPNPKSRPTLARPASPGGTAGPVRPTVGWARREHPSTTAAPTVPRRHGPADPPGCPRQHDHGRLRRLLGLFHRLLRLGQLRGGGGPDGVEQVADRRALSGQKLHLLVASQRDASGCRERNRRRATWRGRWLLPRPTPGTTGRGSSGRDARGRAAADPAAARRRRSTDPAVACRLPSTRPQHCRLPWSPRPRSPSPGIGRSAGTFPAVGCGRRR